MAVLAQGRITVWDGGSLWIFKPEPRASHTDHHAHHAIQLTLAIEGDFELRADGEAAAGPVVAVAPDARHQFHAGGTAAMLFIDPDGAPGRFLRDQWFRDRQLHRLEPDQFGSVFPALRKAWQTQASDADLVGIGIRIISDLAPAEPPEFADARVDAIIRFVSENLDRRLSLRLAASHINLSPSRVSHLFVGRTGLPLKSYVLWRRLRRAVELYSEGAQLTEAAHGAGFADSAHLSRTFRRTFGLPAASLRLSAVTRPTHP